MLLLSNSSKYTWPIGFLFTAMNTRHTLISMSASHVSLLMVAICKQNSDLFLKDIDWPQVSASSGKAPPLLRCLESFDILAESQFTQEKKSLPYHL